MQQQQPWPKIILCQIVKNEGKIIKRCLESVLPIINGVCICDTGSTDDTKEIIRTFCEENKLPLLLTEEPFQNFGHNRTVVLQQACVFAKKDPETFLLTIDADMCLCGLDKLDRSSLTAVDAWDVEQRAGSRGHWNPRLLRSSIPWKSSRFTHEYLEAEDVPFSKGRLQSLWIDDLNDGGAKADKNERDIRLLQEELKTNPKIERNYFYLGNTFRETGKYMEAIQNYEQHRLLSNWAEERWYSLYYMGICYESLNMWPKALETYLKAYQERPSRAEPLFRIAKHFRNTDQQATAYLFAYAAANIPYPKDDVLFTDRALYEYQILDELSITAYWAQQVDIGRETLFLLLRRKNLPDHVRHIATYNLRFYIQPLAVTMAWERLDPKLPPGYLPCNPSLVFRPDGIRVVNVRAVNYTQKCARNYKAPNDLFQTENVMMTGNDTEGVLVKSPWRGDFVETCRVRGLEDVRLFLSGSQIYATATSLESRKTNVPQIVLCRFENGSVVPLTYTQAEPNRCEKNWLPFVNANNELLAIYGYNPLQIIKLADPATGCCTPKVTAKQTPDTETRHFKGSAGPIQLPSGDYLALVHETCDEPSERRYFHRFLLFSPHWFWKSISDPFYFRHGDGVEMVLSMALHSGVLHIAVGVEDKEAWICRVCLSEVLSCVFG